MLLQFLFWRLAQIFDAGYKDSAAQYFHFEFAVSLFIGSLLILVSLVL